VLLSQNDAKNKKHDFLIMILLVAKMRSLWKKMWFFRYQSSML